jgi:hypothetical protein
MNFLDWEGDMDGMEQTAIGTGTERNRNGRFAPGCSGNPAGKRKGTRNRATLLAAALREDEGEAVARVVIDKALAGDAVAARFCLSLLSPKPRGRAITLDLPEAAGPGDVVAAFNATLAAMAAGEITPDEALVVTKVLDGRLRALKAWQLEEKLTSYGRTIPGDEAMLEEEDEDELSLPDGQESAPDPITGQTCIFPASHCHSPSPRGGEGSSNFRLSESGLPCLSPAFSPHRIITLSPPSGGEGSSNFESVHSAGFVRMATGAQRQPGNTALFV